jgi:predicted TIM-barrel fold metal-dependent hydrolase
MVAAGIGGAVTAGFAFESERDIDEQNEYLLGEGALVDAMAVAPLATVNLALDGWRLRAEKALESGARGFGELRPHNQGWDPLGAESRALCALAGDADVPLLWHVSEPVGHRYPGKEGGISPVELIRLAELAPETKMVAAHLGGGLAYYLQMPEIRNICCNTYFDTAASSLLYDGESIPRLVDLAGPERVLFASDYPLQAPGRQLDRILALVPEVVAVAVCGRNAQKLYMRD